MGKTGIIRFPCDAQGDGERSGCLKLGSSASAIDERQRRRETEELKLGDRKLKWSFFVGDVVGDVFQVLRVVGAGSVAEDGDGGVIVFQGYQFMPTLLSRLSRFLNSSGLGLGNSGSFQNPIRRLSTSMGYPWTRGGRRSQQALLRKNRGKKCHDGHAV